MNDKLMIMDELKRIVGNHGAYDIVSPEAKAHRDWIGAWIEPEAMPDAVVMPRTVEEIQALVKLAASQNFSLSSTPNLTGVGANISPQMGTSVLLDLSQMNQVLEFDQQSAFALLEPGVTFSQLLAYINDQGAKFWIDSDHNGANSIVGSVCERNLGFTPYGDHLLMQCGMEVVLANGEVMRTGMGALPNNNTWQLFKFNFGPYLDGLFSRAHNAIVTKLGLWLMPAAPSFFPFQVALTSEAGVSSAIEALRPLKLAMVIPNTVSITHRSADEILGPQEKIASSAPWNLYGALYGVPKNIELTWGAIHESLSAIEGSIVQAGNLNPSEYFANLRVQLMRGIPAFDDPNPQHALSFSACAPIEGQLALEMKSIVENVFSDAGMVSGNDYSMEYLISPRTLAFQIALPYTRGNYATTRAAALNAINALQTKGFSISHDSMELHADVAASQSANGLDRVYEHINDALDPTQILS